LSFLIASLSLIARWKKSRGSLNFSLGLARWLVVGLFGLDKPYCSHPFCGLPTPWKSVATRLPTPPQLRFCFFRAAARHACRTLRQ
jgi:hypothetical protein